MKPTHISLIYKSVVGCTALLVVFVSISCSSKEDEDKKDQTAPPAASEEQTVSTEAATTSREHQPKKLPQQNKA
ncbi:MAG: hypothetical protein ACYSTJ_02960 [Planctomycetota bacterium]|jgi:hypothetical protein